MISGIPGGAEVLIVLGIALLVFGPKQLPRLANSLGRSITEFKDGIKNMKKSLDIDLEEEEKKDEKKDETRRSNP